MDLDTPCITRTYIQGTRVSFGINLHLQTIKRTHFVSGCQTRVAMDMRYLRQDYVSPFMERNTLHYSRTVTQEWLVMNLKGKSIDMLHYDLSSKIVHRLG
jgi:hypothetical protein